MMRLRPFNWLKVKCLYFTFWTLRFTEPPQKPKVFILKAQVLFSQLTFIRCVIFATPIPLVWYSPPLRYSNWRIRNLIYQKSNIDPKEVIKRCAICDLLSLAEALFALTSFLQKYEKLREPKLLLQYTSLRSTSCCITNRPLKNYWFKLGFYFLA